MAIIHKVDTIELLEDFMLFVGCEVERKKILDFIKQKFPDLKNHERDIWSLVLTHKN